MHSDGPLLSHLTAVFRQLALNHRVTAELVRNRLSEERICQVRSGLCRGKIGENLDTKVLILKMLIHLSVGWKKEDGFHCTRNGCGHRHPFAQLGDWWEHMYVHLDRVFGPLNMDGPNMQMPQLNDKMLRKLGHRFADCSIFACSTI
ncbi:uncharacterized protein FPOAC1_013782 [Fusarium poae]|uniref:uncharacterized protein n=1 Tax=Fusarium poae TaxID=36050 RepID=UPI001D04DD58|nr:uncharacterized protein FPOAC1_013782 [Fusarium poae]KAG8664444.1 hypothetical protein FPOAC1_013782 [Fusarium poae]